MSELSKEDFDILEMRLYDDLNDWLELSKDLIQFCGHCQKESAFKRCWDIKVNKKSIKLIKHYHCELCGNKGSFVFTTSTLLRGIEGEAQKPFSRKEREQLLKEHAEYLRNRK